MAGAGGAFGYILGGIPWSEISFGNDNDDMDEYRSSIMIMTNNLTNSTYFEGIYFKSGLAYDHKQMLFTFVAVLYVICVIISVTSFKEIPLNNLKRKSVKKMAGGTETNIGYGKMNEEFSDDDEFGINNQLSKAFSNNNIISQSSYSLSKQDQSMPSQIETLKYYVSSIINMPRSLRWLWYAFFV
jgi:hypothetical protein